MPIMQRKPVLRFLPMQPGDVLDTYADIDSSKRDLQYRPKTTLRTGLQRFVEWYRSYHGLMDKTSSAAVALS